MKRITVGKDQTLGHVKQLIWVAFYPDSVCPPEVQHDQRPQPPVEDPPDFRVLLRLGKTVSPIGAGHETGELGAFSGFELWPHAKGGRDGRAVPTPPGNRKGNWGPFSIHHILGVGVRADANARSNHHITRIDEQLAGFVDRFSGLADVREMLNSVREDLSDWRQDYLNQSLVIGRAAFKPALDDATPLWKELSARWGKGGGYRVEIASTIKQWFEETEGLNEARRKVDAGLNQAWQELVLDRLVASTRSETEASMHGQSN